MRCPTPNTIQNSAARMATISGPPVHEPSSSRSSHSLQPRRGLAWTETCSSIACATACRPPETMWSADQPWARSSSATTPATACSIPGYQPSSLSLKCRSPSMSLAAAKRSGTPGSTPASCKVADTAPSASSTSRSKLLAGAGVPTWACWRAVRKSSRRPWPRLATVSTTGTPSSRCSPAASIEIPRRSASSIMLRATIIGRRSSSSCRVSSSDRPSRLASTTLMMRS